MNQSKYVRSDATWLKKAKWGVFSHYLTAAETSAEEWNRQVDSFDVNGLASQLESVGAKYMCLTVGQNSGHYCAPNATYDSIVGYNPSKNSNRDLVIDLADALAARGIDMMVYLASGAPARDEQAMERLEWEWGFEGRWCVDSSTVHTGKRLVEFQLKWEAIIREWSLRWGKKVKGWWIDGCYFADEMYRNPEAPNFRSFAEAMKAGNADSIVAFNPGVLLPVICHTEYEDYTAGEISDAFPIAPADNIDGAQYHILSYLGETWGSGLPRLADEFVLGYTKDLISRGGAMTWDVPISPDGHLAEEFMAQFRLLKNL